MENVSKKILVYITENIGRSTESGNNNRNMESFVILVAIHLFTPRTLKETIKRCFQIFFLQGCMFTAHKTHSQRQAKDCTWKLCKVTLTWSTRETFAKRIRQRAIILVTSNRIGCSFLVRKKKKDLSRHGLLIVFVRWLLLFPLFQKR